MTTLNEVNRDKTMVPGYFFFVMFLLSVLLLLLKSISKLIHNRCTCKLYIIKALRVNTCIQTNNLRLCFYVLIRYSLLFCSEIILKQLFALGSVNIVE